MKFSGKKVVFPALIFLAILLAVAVRELRHDRMAGPTKNRKLAPDIVVKDLDGHSVRLSDYRGKLVFLNFWATWCPSCREEMPSMERLNQSMKGRPFQMLSVSIDDTLEDILRFRKTLGYTFPMFLDPDHKAAALYQITGIPETFLIAPDGTLLQRVIGPEDWAKDDVIAAIEKLLP